MLIEAGFPGSLGDGKGLWRSDHRRHLTARIEAFLAAHLAPGK